MNRANSSGMGLVISKGRTVPVRYLLVALLMTIFSDGVKSQPAPPLGESWDKDTLRQYPAPTADSCPPTLIVITSNPERCRVIIDGADSGSWTPIRMTLQGRHKVELSAAGYETLKYQLECEAADSISLFFLLCDLKPPSLTAESLGLNWLSLVPVVDSTIPDRTMRKYATTAETFAVFPLGQGLLTRLLGGSALRDESNVLIVSGAALIAGSVIMGKIVSEHQRSSIRTRNAAIKHTNTMALQNNQDAERRIKLANRERTVQWEKANKPRGKVTVRRYP